MFFDEFSRLCAEKGVSYNKACIDMGLNRSAVAKWRSGSIPNGKTLSAMADYFGVSIDVLVGDAENAAAGDGDSDSDNEMAMLLEDVRRNPELRTMFSLAKGATPDQVRQYIKIIRALRGEDGQ